MTERPRFWFWCDRCGHPFAAPYIVKICPPCAVGSLRAEGLPYPSLPPVRGLRRTKNSRRRVW